MLAKISYWFTFIATSLISFIYYGHTVQLMHRFDDLKNPFSSIGYLFQFTWSVLPLLLVLIAVPLIFRRIVVFIIKRSITPPPFGFIAGFLFVIFLTLLFIVYGTKIIPPLRPLAFGAGIFKLFLTLPLMLSYISCEFFSFFKSQPNPSFKRDAALTRTAP